MTPGQRKELASLLAERVKDKADVDDVVGMFTAARMLDQVNGELREIGEAPADNPAPKPGPASPTGRRIFVRG